jgi:hypothetical protein
MHEKGSKSSRSKKNRSGSWDPNFTWYRTVSGEIGECAEEGSISKAMEHDGAGAGAEAIEAGVEAMEAG